MHSKSGNPKIGKSKMGGNPNPKIGKSKDGKGFGPKISKLPKKPLTSNPMCEY